MILWAARLSVALYAVAVVGWLRRSSDTPIQVRWLWLASWASCVIHVLFAFHFEHHWSHAAALKHTADMTGRVVGWYWGGGLYVNYVFLALWGGHACRWLRNEGGISMHRSFQAVAAFMMINATAVFGPSWWLLPVGTFCLLATVLVMRPAGKDTGL